jgi:hypothetical protein
MTTELLRKDSHEPLELILSKDLNTKTYRKNFNKAPVFKFSSEIIRKVFSKFKRYDNGSFL